MSKALILFVLSTALSYCSESNNEVSAVGDSTGQGNDPLPTCEAGSVAVVFQTGTRGSITGNLTQCVSAGQNATEVAAAPYSGFQFERWTNGEEQVLTQTLVVEQARRKHGRQSLAQVV